MTVLKYLLAIVFALGFASIANSATIGGITGTDTFDYSEHNTMDYSDWPEEYRDLCDKHMRAVVKKCKESGYENWTVSRMYGSNQFLPEERYWGAADHIVGSYKCGYGENTIDEVLISSANLNFACSEQDFTEGTARSDQYACVFSCQAWDCDEDSDPKDIYACTVRNPDPNIDPYDQLTPGCQDLGEEICRSRGTWWKLKFCRLERPCEFRTKGRVEGNVFCKCSCEGEAFTQNFDDAATSIVMAEDFDIDAFNFEEWQRQRKDSCFNKIDTINRVDQSSDLQQDGISSVSDPVKQNFLDNSKLDFSDTAGMIAKDPVTNQPIIGETNTRNTSNIAEAINNSSAGTAALLGVQTGGNSTQAIDTYRLINRPTTVNSVQRDSLPYSTNLEEYGEPPEQPPDTPVEPLDPIEPECTPEWDCTEWGNWGDWKACENDIQTATRTRICTDKNSCGTTEGAPTSDIKTQNCGDTTPTDCTENWSCGEYSSWSNCTNSTQSRTKTCTDATECGTTENKPVETETQSCTDTLPCTESWSCDAFGTWGDWRVCQEDNTQTRTRTKTCTDANSCETTSTKPITSESESQSCTYTPIEQKAPYSALESSLGANIDDLSYSGASEAFDTTTSSGEYGYRILNIPAGATIKVCVAGVAPIGYMAYPQYHYGYDWSTPDWETANPGCITLYNKNSWANGTLIHVGDPTPVSTTGQITITQIS